MMSGAGQHPNSGGVAAAWRRASPRGHRKPTPPNDMGTPGDLGRYRGRGHRAGRRVRTAIGASTSRGDARGRGTDDSPDSTGGSRNTGAGYRRDGSDDAPTNERVCR